MVSGRSEKSCGEKATPGQILLFMTSFTVNPMEQALHLTNCKNNNPFSSYSNKTNSKPSQTKPLATILLDDNTSLITAL